MRTRAARRRESAATPRGTGTEARRRVLGLEALPLPAREAVVLLLCPPANRPSYLQTPVDEGFRALPFVSQETLAALKELQLPIGKFESHSVASAVRRAHALRRAWDLGELKINLPTTNEISALPRCTALHSLHLYESGRMIATDVSVLAGCGALHTLRLEKCNVTDVSAGKLRDAAHS
mmetsp:Transcript_7305/g.21493  ORF Transcript_7305/g.21493 Transcript_7305/m.21493 type:complete len:179 (+) Transcript_7305:946-1482(+)